MPELNLAELRRLEAEATPGPWWSDGRSFGALDGDGYGIIDVGETELPEDATFIAVMRNALSELLKALEWRDISTAPKDGSKILVWADGYEWPEVIYYELYDDDTAAEAGSPGYWRYAEDILADVANVDIDLLTHWRPLLLPPHGGGDVG